MKKQQTWLSQRQEVLAQNVANSDTPKYRASDLKKFNFKELIRRDSMQLNMNASGTGHLPGKRARLVDFAKTVDRRPFETAPNGNSVVLEEQMSKINETAISHRLTNDLYRKHINMLKIAIGKGR